jgi:regulator of protease activity HflC (stomatin/prohibitin superfamily)
MHRQMKAERNRRSMILEAEGHKQSAILKAEGDAEAVRRVAEAEKFRKLTVAAGEAEAVSTVYSAIHEGRPTNDLIAIKYLETLEKIADGRATKIFLPLDTSGVLGSIAGIGELLKGKIGDSTGAVPREGKAPADKETG